ncbi:MAG: FAD-dependent oxidoreductase [Alphaproteobacteria bacterium]|nr:FAD-dependent oxidoreductase [Alphaproteobacteria bacterium]
MSKSRNKPTRNKVVQARNDAALDRRNFLKKGAAVGAVAMGAGLSQAAQGAEATIWDREADVVVIGGGAGGLVAAIAAREKGASVIIVEKNFDIGGRAMMSFGGLYIGGGNRLQKALSGNAPPGRDDTPDKVFDDWSRPEKPIGRFSDRELVRVYADNNLDLFDWLEKHGIRWEGYRPAVDRLDRSRTRLNVVKWPDEKTGPARGPGFVRPLAKTARAMGVEILLQQQMTKIHRESPTSGRVTGISVIEVDDNYAQKTKTMNIRARKGVVVATGGSAGNPIFRTMFDVRLTEEYQAENSEWTQRTADGEIAAMQIGAALGATACQTTQDDNLLNKGRMGKKSNGGGTELYATAPHFFRARAIGIEIEDYQNVILVKENGLRFYTETAHTRDYEYYAAALAWTGDPKKMNGGGPIWAIFDADAVAREKWNVKPPYVDPNGYFFSADTVEELAKKIVNEYQWRTMPPAALKATVERYNSFVDKGVDSDFKKPTPTFKIAKPPFYAAWHTPALHDSYSGIRINTSGQVLDLRGTAIPGLYACGDSSGGFGQHGLCRAATYGRLGGWHAAAQKV